jgi:3-hydroxybutyryl-CoA dehydrogenase
MVIHYTLGRRYQFAGPQASSDLGGVNILTDIARHLMLELAKDETVIEMLAQLVQRQYRPSERTGVL